MLNLGFLAVGDGNIDIFWCLSVAPSGVPVASASRTQALGQDTPIQEISRGVAVIKADAANNVFMYLQPAQIDIKAMRKLKKGDEIRLTHLGSDADYQVVGVAYLWFKE